MASLSSCITSPISCLAGKVVGASFSGFFTTLTQWILDSCQWVVDSAGAVLQATSDPTTITNAANAEFTLLLRAAPVLMVTGLVVTTLSALSHGEPGRLLREYLLVAPALIFGIAVARPMAQLMLTGVDELCSLAVTGSSANLDNIVKQVGNLPTSTPGFALFLLSVFVVIGALALWIELIIRSVFLTLLLTLTPILFSLAVFAPLRRVAWRTIETFGALALSKFVIVVTLSLGLSEVASSQATQILEGVATMALAALSPFLILRLVPLIEQSALHGAEGIRQRATRAATTVSTSPVGVGLGMLSGTSVPEPPTRSDDLGLDTWPGVSPQDREPPSGESSAPPIGKPRIPGGHVVHRTDRLGPVLGWHDDE